MTYEETGSGGSSDSGWRFDSMIGTIDALPARNTEAAGGAETRAKNVALLYCQKT